MPDVRMSAILTRDELALALGQTGQGDRAAFQISSDVPFMAIGTFRGFRRRFLGCFDHAGEHISNVSDNANLLDIKKSHKARR